MLIQAQRIIAATLIVALVLCAARESSAIQFQSNLVMHYDAANVQTSGSSVTRWYNEGTTGATLDALPTAIAPTRVNNVINGLPVVRFNSAVDNTLQTGTLGSDIPQPLTIMHVGLITTTANNSFFYDGQNTAKRAVFYHETATTSSIYGGTGSLSAAPAPLNSFDTWTGVFNGTSSYINRNGSSFAGPGSIGTNPIDGFTIGSRFSSSNRMNGDIAEIAVFSGLFNAAQLKIATNYFSAKYELPVATNLYNGDNNGPGGYDFNVFGIGNSGAITGFAAGTVTSGTEQDGLIINSTGSLDVNDFVLAGDQNLANGLTNDNAPAGTERWERVWNIDQTGTSNFNLVFDYSDAGLSMPIGGSYQLLYSSSATLNFSVVSETYTVSGDQITFSILGAGFLDGYYTLGVLHAPEPSTAILLGLGALALLRKTRRRHSIVQTGRRC